MATVDVSPTEACGAWMASSDDVVRLARAWIGTPYHHQASRCGVGTDCLGLIRGVWRELYGSEVQQPIAYTRDWSSRAGEELLLRAARTYLVELPPDVIAAGQVLVFRYRCGFAAKHCGLATSPVAFVHAMEGVAVSEVALTSWWRRRIAGVFSFPGIN
ncbi:putative phage cell wall peptidase [Candidatus Filomicrobium marinum]|uniref:Phage cell wall peptidase, NlpC/P60 family n=2 Tax=Filomicrobium TaxID=119044 RepID=A0A1H0SWG2_9HYPH|nr:MULTISPECIES: peptidase P60 [Filomicrobium]CFX31560.1 putative phage cell wall peptidase [Candidatus Filomicrobium marinum]CPR22015.1 putative phage cell wall peptidase [Candidatus Filomicrobium marinum]SDP45995.1 putative phage cell wall peptidase, NlpC/P60 family [Filomicrobium insigne]